MKPHNQLTAQRDTACKSLHGLGVAPTVCQIPSLNHHSPHLSLPSATIPYSETLRNSVKYLIKSLYDPFKSLELSVCQKQSSNLTSGSTESCHHSLASLCIHPLTPLFVFLHRPWGPVYSLHVSQNTKRRKTAGKKGGIEQHPGHFQPNQCYIPYQETLRNSVKYPKNPVNHPFEVDFNLQQRKQQSLMIF